MTRKDLPYNTCLEKKKKTLIYLISGIIVIIGIGTITYFVWPKNKPTENKEPTNSKEKIQQLQTELSSLRSKLNNISDTTKKSQLENKLSSLENQINNFANSNNSPSQPTIKKLEQEIKEIKKQTESDEPDEDPGPTNKNKAKVEFKGKSLKVMGDSDNFDNYKFMEKNGEHIFYISKNHPRIKELLNQGKLQKDKQFTLRYGKVDEKSDGEGLLLTFNENNQELEIMEVKQPEQPDPENNGVFKWISTKINNDTYKYKITLNNGGEIDFANFIIFLRTKDKDFFKAFQGALKDANSKFGGYFWKCPPVSKNTLGKPFEFVVIKSEALNNIKQNFEDFREHLAKGGFNEGKAYSFPNLGKNAILVIPSLKISADNSTPDYKNISQFTKNASEEHQQVLWQEVAKKMSEELVKGDAPRWLNTHGLGVEYLHVRIDESNKYYSNYKEYGK